VINYAKQRKQLAVRAKAGTREKLGIPPGAGWFLVCAVIPVKWSHPFLWMLTVVQEIASEIRDIEAVRFDPNLIQTMER
jgi:hypothetical protein